MCECGWLGVWGCVEVGVCMCGWGCVCVDGGVHVYGCVGVWVGVGEEGIQ